MIEIKFEHPDEGPGHTELSYDDEPFTVGRSEDCTVSLPTDQLSRLALVIKPEGMRLKIWCGQRFGYVHVTRDDGVRKATLHGDEEFGCGAGTYRVLLRTAAEEVFTAEVSVGERQRILEPGVITTGMWSHRQLFDPTPEDDWRWFAALVTVVAQSNARHKGKALGLLAKAWHYGDWNGHVQKRLDKVIEKLAYTEPGANKQDAIAFHVRSAGLIQPADYVAFRDEVQSRARTHLSRADIGLLGWSYLFKVV